MAADSRFLCRITFSTRPHKAAIVSDITAEANAVTMFDDSGTALFISE